MDDFQKSSWGDLFIKKLKNMMAPMGDKHMKASKNSNHYSRKLKQLLSRYFISLAVTTTMLLFGCLAKVVTKLMQDSAQEQLEDRTTVQLGAADPVAMEKEPSTMFTQKKLIRIDSVAELSAGQSVKANTDKVMIKVPAGQTSFFEFPDGSKALVNSMSTLWFFRAEFKKSNRKVYLQGQAYFDVEHDAQRPFTVITDSLNVTVVGTSFGIRCYQSERQSQVALRSGSVLVEMVKGQVRRILAPGKSAILDKVSGKFEVEAYDPFVAFGWIHDNYIIPTKPLPEICNELSRLYGERIIIDNLPLSDKCFFLRFNRKKPLRDLLEYLHDNDSLNYYQTKDGVWHIQ